MSTFEQKQIERYLPELTRLSHDARLELIARLALSLKQGESAGEKSFDKLHGAWQSEESAEELVEMIRGARTPNSDPEPFD
jgi:hypothetical protein